MLGLERLLQSNYHPASEITPSATYFPIRPAHSTRWPLLLCPFPASIFLHLPIDFLFADFYEIVHGVPWWLEDAPEGWYARAMDAGSWYTIVIPDSIVSQVQAICEEQARYPEQDFFYSVLYHADTVRVPVEPGAWDQIKDQETVSALANLFLENLTVPTSNWQPERVSAKDQYPFTFILSLIHI